MRCSSLWDSHVAPRSGNWSSARRSRPRGRDPQPRLRQAGRLIARTVRRGVALRALGLGDLLTGLPALRGLRRVRPDHRLVVATSPGVGALASRALGDADVVAVGELAALPFGTGIDLAVNLHGRG